MEIDKQQAKRLYKDSAWLRPELIKEFGEDLFREKSFKDIKTFDDACKACETSEVEFDKKFKNLGLGTDTLNYEKLKIIAQAINQGWQPDWSNSNEAKWYPYFAVLPSGSGFSRSGSHYDYVITDVGSRLCFESSEKAIYAAEQFADLYTKYLLITQ